MESKLRELITKAEKKVENKQKLIAKKEASLAAGALDRWDTEYAQQDIKRLNREISELNEVIKKHQDRIFLAEAEEHILANMPEALKQLQDHLVERWDAFDTDRLKLYRDKYKEMGYADFVNKYHYRIYEFMRYSTAETIHKDNVKDAKNLILNTVARVGAITGEITDCRCLNVNYDNNGLMILNGLIIGKNGTAELNSIMAGGYNIQKLHIRVLVKAYTK